jgi:TonB-dependent starch-binding outer membrane protein SusC
MGKAPTLLLLLCAMVMPFILFAQVQVSGIVMDSSNTPLNGVSVQLRNSATGTTTDANGRFTLTIPSQSGVLQFSYVGFQPKTVDLKGAGTQLTVVLQGESSRLQEVVVTGIATSVKRSNLANAVSSISAKELTGTTVQPTLDAAMYGKFTGSNISANSGAPGGGISVKLRGITSLVANSQPLYIVDGVYYDNSAIVPGLNAVSRAAGQGSTDFQDNQSNRIADLDPEDIDRIEILKGASAAAIYGSRAAAGVVIITTKRGKTGQPRIELGYTIGTQWQLKELGHRQWSEEKVLAAYDTTGLDLYRQVNGQIFNYEEELYGNDALLQQARISINGGGERTKYFVGFTHKDDEGIVKGTGYRKTSFRVNLDQEIASFLDLSVNANYVTSRADRGYFNNDNTSTTLGVSYVSTPWWLNLYPDANGNYPNNDLGSSNFIQTRDLMTNRENVDRILLGGSGTWKILQSGKHDLRLIARGGLDQYTLNTVAIFPRELQFQKEGNGTNGASIQGTTPTKSTNLSAFLVHSFDISQNLNLRTQAGVTAEKLKQNTVLNTATQLIGTQTNVSQASSIQVQQNRIEQKDRGFFVQAEVNYKDLLIATAGVRGDKSSRNGDANKLYYYPKGSAAFNVHKLGSWNSETISQLKLRVAYGQSGNFAPFGAIYTPLLPALISGSTGSLITTTRGNTDLQPERQKELETGVDLGLFNNRLGIEATYYNKDVEDLILDVVVPLSSGFEKHWRNVAAIENRGFEIAVNATPVSNTNFNWTQTTSFWTNEAEVTRLDVPAFNDGAFGATLGTYRIEQGKSPTQIVGIGGPDDKVDPVTGLAVYGDGEPDFNLSSFHTLRYKAWEFNVLVHWKKGGDNINLTTLLSDLSGSSPDYDDKTLDPTGQQTNGDYRVTALGTTARPWVEDASYFRFREMSLSYQLPKTLFKNIASMRLGVSGRNLINVFDYSSYDPEVSNFGSGAISSNVEVTPFPSAKSVYFHVTVNF